MTHRGFQAVVFSLLWQSVFDWGRGDALPLCCVFLFLLSPGLSRGFFILYVFFYGSDAPHARECFDSFAWCFSDVTIPHCLCCENLELESRERERGGSKVDLNLLFVLYDPGVDFVYSDTSRF